MNRVERLFGLIGYPLTHSFSKRYFSEKFEREGIDGAAYELFPLKDIGHLPDLISQHSNLCGLNVTIPYKEAVIPFLDRLDAEAAAVGAVNTIRIESTGLTGYNTDVFGFEKSLSRFLEENSAGIQSALVLGTGGAAKAVGFVLKKMGIAFRFVSRRPGKETLTYEQLDGLVMENSRLLINTTPLGMSPHTDTCPAVPYERLTAGHLLYDLVYNPEKTLFLKQGEARGCPVLNGLEMLYLQAERSWAIWNSK